MLLHGRQLFNSQFSNHSPQPYSQIAYLWQLGQVVMATSTDAFTWTSRTTGTTAPINGLAYGAGVYAFAANGGALASSTDAITWTARSSFTTQTLSAMTFGTLFVAAGAQGTVVTSTDGTTWSGQAPINAGINIFAAAYNTNLYVLGGGSGSIYTSTDAMTWVTR